MNEEELKQLKAYKVGYDLGWYRAMESISHDLQEIADGLMNSDTVREVEKELGGKPLFLAKVMNIIVDIRQMRDENLPTLLIERQAITSLGEGLMNVLSKDPAALDYKSNDNLLSKPQGDK